MDLHAVLVTVTVMIYIASHISLASADQCTQIEYTTDNCRNADLIVKHRRYHHGSGGQIVLPYPQRELIWNCGSSRERVGFGGEGNRIDFYFASDGTVKWWIYKCTPCKLVDTTYENCRSASSILVWGQRIYKGTLKRVIKLPGHHRSVFWYCGATRERTAWGKGAVNELNVSYFHDGRIEFVVKNCY